MDDETFRKHYNARHLADAEMGAELPDDARWVKLNELWRAFHRRCHEIAVPGQYDHDHLGEWE